MEPIDSRTVLPCGFYKLSTFRVGKKYRLAYNKSFYINNKISDSDIFVGIYTDKHLDGSPGFIVSETSEFIEYQKLLHIDGTGNMAGFREIQQAIEGAESALAGLYCNLKVLSELHDIDIRAFIELHDLSYNCRRILK